MNTKMKPTFVSKFGEIVCDHRFRSIEDGSFTDVTAKMVVSVPTHLRSNRKAIIETSDLGSVQNKSEKCTEEKHCR